MTYAAKQDMIDRFGDEELALLTDRVNGAVVDDVVLTRALEDADAKINAYIGKRYSLPLASMPRVILAAAADIARYGLYEDRATETVKERHGAAIKFLESVAAGRVSLGDIASAIEIPGETGGPAVQAPDRVFTQDTLKDFG